MDGELLLTILGTPARVFDDYAWAVAKLRIISRLAQLLWAEAQDPVRLSWRSALRGWVRGFRRRATLAYDLENRPNDDYISDWTQFIRSPGINGIYDYIVNNKAAFPLLMSALGIPCPQQLATIVAGKLLRARGPADLDGSNWIRYQLDQYPGLVIKPTRGAHGHGILFLELRNNRLIINGSSASLEDLRTAVAALDHHVVTERIHQHQYAARIFPSTVNTVRILTLWDYTQNSPFLAAAVQRFGLNRSFPVDNFDAGWGGLCSNIDLKTGVLGPSASISQETGTWNYYHNHPETNSPIAGEIVPHWEFISAEIVRAAEPLGFAPLLGWDLAITEEGFCVIEINGSPGLFLHEIHRPLLSDPRTRRFYQAHGLLH